MAEKNLAKELGEGEAAKPVKRVSLEFNPAKIVLTSFVLVILTGALLLMLPFSAVEAPLSLVDAFFMSTSAVCVTGLATVSVGHDLTRFGQCVILALIQIGGLGIMIFSLFFMLMGKKATLFSRLDVWDLSRHKDTRSVLTAVLFVFLMTLSIEAAGTLLLLPFFAKEGVTAGVFDAVFHAVSGFCNAGFSTYDDSLSRFYGQPAFLMIMMGLIVTGGLGFVVIDEMRRWGAAWMKRQSYRMSLHSRVVLIITAALLLGGMAAFLVLENANQFAGMRWWQKLFNALFLSVTARTAGFNTVDTGLLTHPTLFLLLILMFIGGAPSSTAGGIKVTTLAVVWAFFTQQARGANQTVIARRQMPSEITRKATLIFISWIVITTFGVLALLLTESFGVARVLVRGNFMDILFESVSAMGTVGLSTGITPDLAPGSKWALIAMMLIGRVGPLTLALAILSYRYQSHVEYAEETVIIG